MLTPEIEACSFDIEVSFFGSFDIEVWNYNIEVLDFEETLISNYFEVLRYRSILRYRPGGWQGSRCLVAGPAQPERRRLQQYPWSVTVITGKLDILSVVLVIGCQCAALAGPARGRISLTEVTPVILLTLLILK
jgi:hypothetical protein